MGADQKMRKTAKSLFATVALTLLAAGPVSAQNIDKAVGAYKSGNYKDAATRFFEVLEFSDEPGLVAESQYGLAASFAKLELPMAALKYYTEIVREGSDHPYFTKAVEGLLDVGDTLQDDYSVPSVLDSMYDRNLNALQKMKPEIQQRINYVIAERLFRRRKFRDARAFAKTVRDGNPAYPRAQYLLGLIHLKVDQPGGKKPNYDKAMDAFENVRRAVKITTKDQERAGLRDLATMGVARALYEQAYLLEDGDPNKRAMLNQSVEEYRSVPRFAGAWADALFERAWAHTVDGSYGKALGAIHSLETPYFDATFYPEALILRAIVYWYNCQWDRVNETLGQAKDRFGPYIKTLDGILAENFENDEWVTLLQKSIKAGPGGAKEGLVPYPVAKHIEAHPRYQKLNFLLTQIDSELNVFQKDSAFSRGNVGREMVDFTTNTRDDFIKATGVWVKRYLKQVRDELEGVTTRASIISLETKTAEAQWLEQGRKIANQERARLPRPFVPDDTYQFWWYHGENWIDELGYYEYSIKTECFE
jgi:tetratricopeptide (TPR) repeat protein